jgi:hypothetical protein
VRGIDDAFLLIIIEVNFDLSLRNKIVRDGGIWIIIIKLLAAR